MSNVTLQIEELLHLFDEDRTATRHTNAIKTMLGEPFLLGLLVMYLQEQGEAPEILLDKDGQPVPCVTGHAKGHRLDAWLRTRTALYQVEVKFWSAHGVGSGGSFRKPTESWPQYGERLWASFWSESERNFKEKSLKKVLIPMTPDPKDQRGLPLKPLACLWSPVQPHGETGPFFSMATQGTFESLQVFSASVYLRSKLSSAKTLTMTLPDYVQRMNRIKRLVIWQSQ